jgi:hypothetical protein
LVRSSCCFERASLPWPDLGEFGSLKTAKKERLCDENAFIRYARFNSRFIPAKPVNSIASDFALAVYASSVTFSSV